MRQAGTALLVLKLLALSGCDLGCESWRGAPLPALDAQVQTAEWAVDFWQPRHRLKLAERAAMKRVDMVWLGDSLTHYWEREGAEVWRAHYAERYALNLGFSGDSTEHALWRIRNGEVDGISPKLVIVLIGTNNAGLRHERPEHTAAGIRAIVDELLARLPTARILLLALFPRGATPQDPVRLLNQRTNRLIARFADGRRVHFADIGSHFLDPSGALSVEIMSDAIHLTPRGYAIWANAMQPQLDALIPQN